MPRTARIKDACGIYHIMIRSISEVLLFKDREDKVKYLTILKKYQKIFRFKIYAYCLMNSHAHFIMDCCGADISMIMKSLNQCYVAYFNKRYNRHGHLLQDRFKSKIIDNAIYLINLSAYIHNNPKDIKGYEINVAKYEFSSYGIYLGNDKDKFEILDSEYILNYFGTNMKKSRLNYENFVKKAQPTIEQNKDEIAELADYQIADEPSEAPTPSERKILIRDFQPNDIIKFISIYTNTNFNVHIKYNHRHTELKALSVLIMRSLCNYSYNDICGIFGNVTISNLWRLCEKGYNLITKDSRYISLIDDIISQYTAA